MAKTYTVTLTPKFWKQHRCFRCGALFRYQFAPRIQGQGNSESQARTRAETALAQALINKTNYQPCPSCGAYQAEMIAGRRHRSNVFALIVALVGIPVVFGIGAAHGMSLATAAWLGGGVGILSLLIHLQAATNNPNRGLGANLALAQQQVAKGMLVLDRAGSPAPLPAAVRLPKPSPIALLLVLIAALGAMSPELLRLGNGWQRNDTQVEVFPPVAGPGDTLKVYFPEGLSSIKGTWSGDLAIALENAREFGAPPIALSGTTKHDSWGDTFNVEDDEVDQSTALWAQLTIPDDERLDYRTLQVRLDLEVDYPEASGVSFFDKTTKRSLTLSLALAGPGVGGLYGSVWNGGFAVAFVLLMGVSIGGIKRWGRQRAHDSRVQPMDEPTGAFEQPWADESGTPVI